MEKDEPHQTEISNLCRDQILSDIRAARSGGEAKPIQATLAKFCEYLTAIFASGPRLQ